MRQVLITLLLILNGFAFITWSGTGRGRAAAAAPSVHGGQHSVHSGHNHSDSRSRMSSLLLLGAGGPGIALDTIDPPAGLIAVPGDGEVELLWTRSPVIQQWFVYRNTIDDFATATWVAFGMTFTSITPPQPPPRWNDATATNGVTYYYWVTSVEDVTGDHPDFIAGNESLPSPVASATPGVATEAWAADTTIFNADIDLVMADFTF